MKLFASIFLFLITQFSFADSPITSTAFASAYKNVAEVSEALNSDGQLSNNFCSYLHNSKNKLAVKLAIINALSWDFDGKSNYITFLEYLIKHDSKITADNFKKNASGDQLICLAYLKAMDDYFDVNEALILADLALKKAKKSYAIHIIHGLIKAQSLFSKDWCDLWKATDKVRQNKKLKNDFDKKAKKIIFVYMDLYEDDCNKK